MKKSEVTIPIRGTASSWPRNQEGDPAFDSFDSLHVLFSDVQIIAMCNRYLRQQEYQSGASKTWEKKQRLQRQLLREKTREK